jgi:hypothetical protein
MPALVHSQIRSRSTDHSIGAPPSSRGSQTRSAPSAKRASPPASAIIHSAPSRGWVVTRAIRRVPSAAVQASSIGVNSMPSKRTSPSNVAIQTKPSPVNATPVACASGSPSSVVH